MMTNKKLFSWGTVFLSKDEKAKRDADQTAILEKVRSYVPGKYARRITGISFWAFAWENYKGEYSYSIKKPEVAKSFVVAAVKNLGEDEGFMLLKGDGSVVVLQAYFHDAMQCKWHRGEWYAAGDQCGECKAVGHE